MTTAPQLTRIHHVAYRCRDAAQTVEWYGRVLGMAYTTAFAEDTVPSTGEDDPYMHVFLDAGGGNVLAFFELPGQPEMGRDERTPAWVQHLAFEVADEAALLAAKAHGRMALDSVYLDIKDLDGLGKEVDDAVAVGFDAKVAIHPSQVAVIRAGYAPTPDQVDWARHVLAAARDERGVFQYGGLMVDAPVLRRAERIVALAPTDGG